MSAYAVFIREKTLDEAELARYMESVGATLQGREVKMLASYGRFEVLEGANIEGMVIAQFPSMAAAKAWYDGPAYREAREHRFKGSTYHTILIEGALPSANRD
jgi:uncharacterized protein (DUF1330 family)